MKSTLGLLALPLCFGLLEACAASDPSTASSSSELRELSEAEVLGDLDFLGATLRLQYGGLEYKKSRFGFDLDAELTAARAKIQAATTEGDRIRPLYELLAKLKDGQVGLTMQLRSDSAFESVLGLAFVPVEGGYYLSFAPPTVANGLLRFGDKLVAIDGMPTSDLEALIVPLTEIGTPQATRHRVANMLTNRPFYAPAGLKPVAPIANLTVQHLDGTSLTVQVPWTKQKGLAGQSTFMFFGSTPGAETAEPTMFSPTAAFLIDAESRPMNAAVAEPAFDYNRPFYLTPTVQEQLGVVAVNPRPETLTTYGVFVPPAMPAGAGGPPGFSTLSQLPLRAYKYRSAGKTILLVRIPSFSLPFQNFDQNVGWLGALLADNLAPPASDALADAAPDVLVVDVARNAGGSVSFAQGVASLLTTKPIGNIVQASRANRLLVDGLITSFQRSTPEGKPIWKARLDEAQASYDRGDFLAPFAPLTGGNLGPTFPFVGAIAAGSEMVSPHPLVQWNKPVLVLTDELSSAAGDAFPAMLKHAGAARTFGAATSGAGGTVKYATLPSSSATLTFPTGLFGAYEEVQANIRVLENEGVPPDYPYEVSTFDFRGGYAGYAAAFTSAAVGMVTR